VGGREGQDGNLFQSPFSGQRQTDVGREKLIQVETLWDTGKSREKKHGEGDPDQLQKRYKGEQTPTKGCLGNRKTAQVTAPGALGKETASSLEGENRGQNGEFAMLVRKSGRFPGRRGKEVSGKKGSEPDRGMNCRLAPGNMPGGKDPRGGIVKNSFSIKKRKRNLQGEVKLKKNLGGKGKRSSLKVMKQKRGVSLSQTLIEPLSLSSF